MRRKPPPTSHCVTAWVRTPACDRIQAIDAASRNNAARRNRSRPVREAAESAKGWNTRSINASSICAKLACMGLVPSAEVAEKDCSGRKVKYETESIGDAGA